MTCRHLKSSAYTRTDVHAVVVIERHAQPLAEPKSHREFTTATAVVTAEDTIETPLAVATAVAIFHGPLSCR